MDSNWESTSKMVLLPELKILTQWQQSKFRNHYKCCKDSEFEVGLGPRAVIGVRTSVMLCGNSSKETRPGER